MPLTVELAGTRAKMSLNIPDGENQLASRARDQTVMNQYGFSLRPIPIAILIRSGTKRAPLLTNSCPIIE